MREFNIEPDFCYNADAQRSEFYYCERAWRAYGLAGPGVEVAHVVDDFVRMDGVSASVRTRTDATLSAGQSAELGMRGAVLVTVVGTARARAYVRDCCRRGELAAAFGPAGQAVAS